MSKTLKFLQDTASWLNEIETRLKKYRQSLKNYYITPNMSLSLWSEEDPILKELLNDIESLESDITECDTRIKSHRTEIEDGKDSDEKMKNDSLSYQCELLDAQVYGLNLFIIKKICIKLFSGVDEVEKWLERTIIIAESLNEDTDDYSKNEIAKRIVESKTYFLKAESIRNKARLIVNRCSSDYQIEVINERVDSMNIEFSKLSDIVKSKGDLALETCRQFKKEIKSIQILENLGGIKSIQILENFGGNI
jgi:hypothetical protein